MKLLEGKKTYIVMLVTIILSVIDEHYAQCMTEVCASTDIPNWIYGVMAGLGVWTRRVAKT